MSEELNETPEKKKKSTLSFLIEFIIYIALIIVCVLVVPKYVLQRTVVEGPSMEDTLHTGESLLVEKVSKNFQDPKRFDIIVFSPYGSEVKTFYVKRVIGLPGETIQIVGNDVLINGKKIEEHFGKTEMVQDDAELAAEPLTLADDEFFVLGDNREVSLDSRGLGPIQRKNLVGRSLIRIWPLSKFGVPE